jgi:acetyl-CoA C-acetyltransferase
MISEQPIYIVSAQRSAIGTFGGILKNISAADILTPVMHHAIAKSGIAAEAIDTTVLGNVTHTSSIDPNLARKCRLMQALAIMQQPMP